jgi:hypothetical protein
MSAAPVHLLLNQAKTRGVYTAVSRGQGATCKVARCALSLDLARAKYRGGCIVQRTAETVSVERRKRCLARPSKAIIAAPG